MNRARIGIISLAVALVASNVWWFYHALDNGITLTYMGVSLDANKEALSQTLAILPLVASGNASRESVLAAARPPGDKSESFEKDGFVWIGKIGLHPELIAPSPAQSNQTWDVFISHASEDKATFVDGLASALTAAGLAVWYDKFQLRLGDSLRRSIDTGLANSKYGLVVLSPAFFAKSWPQRELDGIVSKETNSGKILLPVWHNVDFEYILKYSPMLADRIGVLSSRGVHEVAKAILAAIEK